MGRIQYQIITTMKESDKGSVYLATMAGYRFPVVVKCLKHGNRQVFEAIQSLKSDRIPEIYLIEETEDGLLLAEEYIEGELLSDRIREGAFTEAQYLDISKQLCMVLSELHHHVPPLIHRDIKPSNIIVNSKGIVKLIDFDSSRVYKEDSDGDTRLLGTEKYAAPEQYGFSQTDSRSDIYSLGVVFGSFSGAFSEARRKRWNKLVERCTLFAPESRFQTVEEILREITKLENIKTGRNIKMGIGAGALIILAGVTILLLMLENAGKNMGKTGTELTQPAEEVFSGMQPEDETHQVVTPEPSPSPSPMPSPSPSSTPSPTPTSGLSTEDRKRTAPVWRDDANDSMDIIALKRLIRTRQLVVLYYFKENMNGKDFLYQESRLDRERYIYRRMRMVSEETGNEVRISADVKGGIIQISAEEMKAVNAGFYTLEVEMYDSDNKEDICNSIYLYVAENDPYEVEEMFLQNTTFSYYGGEGEVLHLVVKNESGSSLTEVLTEEGQSVDPELYRVKYDGRVIELSDAFLRTHCKGEGTLFFVKDTENRRTEFFVYNKENRE